MSDDDISKHIKRDTSGAREVVLPSGRYARLRKLTAFDLTTCYDENAFRMMAMVMVSAVTIDDKPLDVDDLKTLDLEEAAPIYGMISEALKQAMQFHGGIK